MLKTKPDQSSHHKTYLNTQKHKVRTIKNNYSNTNYINYIIPKL